MFRRLQGAWRGLDSDQRLAAFAALALLATMFLPWYQATVVVPGPKTTTPTFSAFGVFSFVEAAVFLVSLGVFLLLFARGEKRGFHLPGGDGTVIFAAGLWAGVLLLWRVFDRPDIERAASDGITWGLFFAFLAAGALAASGWKIRAAHRPEPPIVVDGDRQPDYGHRTTPRRRRPQAAVASRRNEQLTEQLTLDDATAVTRVERGPSAPELGERAAPAPAAPEPEPDAGPQPIPGDRPLWADAEPSDEAALPPEPSPPQQPPREEPPSSAAPPPRAARRARVFDQDDIEPGEIPRAPDR
jgi:hypothetical protein